MSAEKDPQTALIADMAIRLRTACDAFERAAYFLRVARLVSQGQVADLGSKADLENATPQQKNAWVVFTEISSILKWFEQTVAELRDTSKTPEEKPTSPDAPESDEKATFH